MDLAGIDIATKNVFAAEYSLRKILVIKSVDLPFTFCPRTTDLVFLVAGANCEVYFDARVTYTGADHRWLGIMRRMEAPGNTRLIVACMDFFSAFRAASTLLAINQETGTVAGDDKQRRAWLQTLGLSGDPDVGAIKNAYRKLAMIYHPDRLPGASKTELKSAEEEMKSIVEAHRGLVNLHCSVRSKVR